MERKFSEFREPDKSLKHEFGQYKGLGLLHYSTLSMTNIFVTECAELSENI